MTELTDIDQLRVVEVFLIKNTGRGSVWVEKRCSMLYTVHRKFPQKYERKCNGAKAAH